MRILTVRDSHSAISGLDYDERNCILGATDIVLDQMMFSIPIKAGI